MASLLRVPSGADGLGFEPLSDPDRWDVAWWAVAILQTAGGESRSMSPHALK
jgi:hypothetical protein